MRSSIDGRIDHFDKGREHLIGIDIRLESEFLSLFDKRDIGLGHGDEGLEFVGLRDDDNRLTGIEFAVLVVLSGYNAIERSLDVGIGLQEMQRLFGLVIGQFGLVIGLLTDGTRFDKGIHTIHLHLKVSHGELGLFILVLVHANERIAFAEPVTYLDVDMLYTAGEGRSHIDGLIA